MNTSVLLADFSGMLQALFGVMLFVMALFLILLVLVQRGRGGGLSGAFGGMGGQSAFGSRAGDTFTKITVIAATAWILLCILAVRFLGTPKQLFNASAGNEVVSGLEFPEETDASEGTIGGTAEQPPTDGAAEEPVADGGSAPSSESAPSSDSASPPDSASEE